MSTETKVKHKRVKRIVLPKVTREQVLAEMPDLAWRRTPDARPHVSSDQATQISNYYYEGRGGG